MKISCAGATATCRNEVWRGPRRATPPTSCNSLWRYSTWSIDVRLWSPAR